MSYIRVIPRDLFNEASLLKCLGRLWIALDFVGPRGQAQFGVESVHSFDIRQDEADGSIYVANVPLLVAGSSVHLSRPLNSREPWPLYLSIPSDPDFDVIPVFDDEGMISQEMADLIKGAP